MGAGKSTVAKKLAVELGLDFFDLDVEIEKKSDYTITETIFNKGELFFRKLERETLEELLNKDNFILATGGGTPCYYDNMELMNNNALTIYLKYSVIDLYERLEGNQSERPLIAHLQGQALKEYIGKHLFERAPFYEKAIMSFDGSSENEKDIIQSLKELVNE